MTQSKTFSLVPSLVRALAFATGIGLAAPAGAEAPVLAGMCDGCHGAGGVSANPGIPSLAGQHAVYQIDALKSYRDGRRSDPMMMAVAMGLSEEQIGTLSRHYAEQAAGERPTETLEGDAARARTHSCGGCHGKDGDSHSPLNPKLNGLSGAYLLTTLKAYRDGGRANGPMRALVAPLTDEELRDLAAYYATR